MTREFTDADYNTVAGWWDQHGFARLPREVLGEGWIVESGGVPVLAGWLYIARGKPTPRLGMFMWPISNPAMSSLVRAQAWTELMERVDLEAQRAGLWMIWTGTASEPLIQRMESHGYRVYEGGSANMLKQVAPVIAAGPSQGV